jgi:hypothetical protein
MPPPSSCRIDGRAMLTITASSVIMKNPSTAAARVSPEVEPPRTPWLARGRLTTKVADT